MEDAGLDDVAPEEAEVPPGLQLALNLREALTAFEANQKDLLYTAGYIVKQRAELDDIKEITRERVKRDFPDVEETHFDDLWESCTYLITPKKDEDRKKPSDIDSGGDANDENAEDDFHSIMKKYLDLLPDESSMEYILVLLRAQVDTYRKPHSSRLQASLLTSLIADFEVMMGNLLRLAITAHPMIINSSERAYTWAEIAQFDDLLDFKNHQIERAIDSLLYGSYDDWLEYLEKKLHIKIPKLARDDKTREIFQRRHMIVHNGGLASKQYLDNVGKPAAKVAIGQKLTVDEKYLLHASDRILVIGVYLVHAVANQFVKDPEELRVVESAVGSDTTYELLQNRRYEALIQVRQMIPPEEFKNVGTQFRFRINCWLAMKRLNKFADCRQEVISWDASVLDPLFRLAKHALLDEVEDALRLVKELRASKTLPLRHWLTWPLLEEVREHANAKSGTTAVLEIKGES